MNSRRLHSLFVWFLALCFIGLAVAAAKSVQSDINGPEKRRALVDLATKLTKPATVAALSSDLVSPFNPPGFDLTDEEERRAAAAAANSGKVVAPKVVNDRDTLEQLASKLNPTGTIIAGADSSRWILNFGKQAVKVGTHFTVTLNGQDYDLELVSIDRTTFTLRLNREEITRSIKPGKSQ
jgi:hypothetical protein